MICNGNDPNFGGKPDYLLAMKALDRKLARDLLQMKGQILAIVLVIMSGVSTFVMFRSTMDSLNTTRASFYRAARFADVFVPLKRAPESVREAMLGLPGVSRVETRVAADAKLVIPGFPDPVSAHIVSLRDDGKQELNRLYLRSGRFPEPFNTGEVVMSEAFAQAHGMSPGSSFAAVINGRWRTLTVTGIALSPEFVLQVRPGAISPDFKRYGILWMGRKALGTAYQMDGAFNDAVVTIAPGARPEDVIARLDALLNRYGGLGAVGRKDQSSHRFLSEEFKQLDKSAIIYPSIFIAVASYLLNVVITRTVNTQREQIASLKAIGYGTSEVAIHYVKFVLVIVALGVAGGTLIGIWLGRALGRVYMHFYRFPELTYVLRPSVVASAAAIMGAAALAGTAFSVWKAVRIPPAQAMRPEQPPAYGRTMVERIVPANLLSQPTRIIARNIERRPLKAVLSVIGIAFACAIMMTGGFFHNTIDSMVDIQFKQSHREDMTVTFTDPAARRSLYELKGMPGIEYAEPFRTVPVRFRFGHREYRTMIRGIEEPSRLYRLLDTRLATVTLPPAGLVLTDYLRGLLGIEQGDRITVEVLEGRRQTVDVPVAGFVHEYIGVMGYMNLGALNCLLRDGDVISGASLAVDEQEQQRIYQTFVNMPRVAGTVVRRDEISNFYETQAESILFFTSVATLLAAVIAFGVVYNSARISLSERSRELASLRVLGYTRGEISYILLGELAALTLAAVPVGLLLGRLLCAYVAYSMQTDIFRIPLVIEPATYAQSAAVVMVSAAVSGMIVRHRLDHLDLVEVLKTRE